MTAVMQWQSSPLDGKEKDELVAILEAEPAA